MPFFFIPRLVRLDGFRNHFFVRSSEFHSLNLPCNLLYVKNWNGMSDGSLSNIDGRNLYRGSKCHTRDQITHFFLSDLLKNDDVCVCLFRCCSCPRHHYTVYIFYLVFFFNITNEIIICSCIYLFIYISYFLKIKRERDRDKNFCSIEKQRRRRRRRRQTSR